MLRNAKPASGSTFPLVEVVTRKQSPIVATHAWFHAAGLGNAMIARVSSASRRGVGSCCFGILLSSHTNATAIQPSPQTYLFKQPKASCRLGFIEKAQRAMQGREYSSELLVGATNAVLQGKYGASAGVWVDGSYALVSVGRRISMIRNMRADERHIERRYIFAQKGENAKPH